MAGDQQRRGRFFEQPSPKVDEALLASMFLCQASPARK
jgi:hypothetical protein